MVRLRESVFANILLVRQIESTFLRRTEKRNLNRANREAQCVSGCSKNGETISWRDQVNLSLQIFFWCDKSNPPFAAHRKKKFKSGKTRSVNVCWAIPKTVKQYHGATK